MVRRLGWLALVAGLVVPATAHAAIEVNVAGGTSGRGGGIGVLGGFASGFALDVRGSTFAENASGEGGAIGVSLTGDNPRVSVTDSTIRGNTASMLSAPAPGYGGGIFVGAGGRNPTITLDRDLIAGNSATSPAGSQGGGVYLLAAPVSGGIVNTTISGNAAQQGGGLVVTEEYQAKLVNVTLAGNTASLSGGNIFLDPGTPLSLVNTIVTGGSAPAHPDCDGAVTSLGHNLEQGTDCGLTSAGDVNADPLLGPLQANGGPTQTHALLPGSPALGAGLPSACPATDQRGVARKPACDIGAFEAPAPAPPGPGPGPPGPPPPLACVSGQLILTDVFPNGKSTQLIGVAPAGAAGQTVTVVSAWNKKTVATAKVGADLSFSARAPLPPRKLRTGNRARYSARLGEKSSAALKFARRLYTTALSVSGGKVRFAGRVVPPLAKRPAPVVIRASVKCSTIAKGTVVAGVKPKRNGSFSATFTPPAGLAGQAIVFLRAQTSIRAKRTSRRTASTFSLIRGVRLG